MEKLEWGMPFLIELKDLGECVSVAKELGLDFIEINMNLPQFQAERIDVQELRKFTESGVYFTFHIDENFNAADFNSKISNAYVDTMMSTIEIAKHVNAPIINMHMAKGVYFTMPDKKVYLFEQYSDYYMSGLTKFRNKCATAIGGSSIKVCIENCDGYLPFMQKGIDLLLESNVFQLTFDIGHSHTANNADEPFILARQDRLCHMHIHDAVSGENHLALGKCEIDLKERLALARPTHSRRVLETKSLEGLKESVSYLRRGDSQSHTVL